MNLDKEHTASQLEMVDMNDKVSTTHQQTGHDQEKSMSLKQAVKDYPYAIVWSILISMAIIMEGYDLVLINSLIAQPSFQRHFGTYHGPSAGYQISGPWQIALTNGSVIGNIFGAFANGWLTAKFGYRKTLIGCLAFVTCTIFVTFFAQNLGMLLAGSILCGMPWGVFATMAPAYASEICPTALRGYLANYICFAWAVGLLLSAVVQETVSGITTQWAYRIPFAIQWAWPLPILCVVFFAPESPWWLLRKGDRTGAEKSLNRLLSKDAEVDIDAAVAMMQHTIDAEIQSQTGTHYADCFKGPNLRRTEITCLTWVCQVFDGTTMTGNPTYFFTQAGLSASISFQMTVGAQSVSCAGVIVSWFLIYYFGRRTLYIFCMTWSFSCLMAIGIAAAVSSSQTSSFAQAGIVCANVAVRFATVGPVCYAIISEISAVNLRNKTISIARCSYYLAQIICNVIYPYMINPTELNWRGKAGFFWAGTCGLMVVWCYFRLPETKGRTFEEIDVLFHDGVSARKFKTTDVDIVHDTTKGEDIKLPNN